MSNKLELTWIGKETPIRIEPRILIENAALSNCTNDPDTENMLIHGDNLLALKALESKYAGQIKCIYIDPPYNTGAAFEYYDDNLEHSIWVNLMRARLIALQKLLAPEGTIWIQIDDEEQAYLKVLCDEIFGRNNFINMVSVNMKNIAGASGGGEDKRLKKNCEFVLIYAKDYESFSPFKNAYDYVEMYDYVVAYRENGKNWHYTSVLLSAGIKEYICSTVDGDGNEIKLFRRNGAIVKSIRQIMKEEGLSEKEVYYKYGNRIFEAKDAQSSIRTRVHDAKVENSISDDIISIEYVPKTGKNRGILYEQFYKGDSCRLFAWLGDISEMIDGVLYKRDRKGTYWDYTSNINNLTKEGGVVFPKGKKPEALVSRILDMTTNPNDLILDSFLGSGTTAAVAHKMGRRYIGIEMGDHAYTHCKLRLDKVIAGDDPGGITKAVNWLGGGGYRFYELAPSLINEDPFGEAIINPAYDADMLAAAMALHEGFTYQPDSTMFWKQSVGSENSYLFVTTRHLNSPFLDSIRDSMEEGEYLIIACRSFEAGLDRVYKNITIKKIPQMLLDRCEFGRTDYNLNIVHPPVYEDEEEETDE
jgi:adenine-specific DNA-methyltransferase